MGRVPEEIMGTETTIVRPETSGNRMYNGIIEYKIQEDKMATSYGQDYLDANAVQRRSIQHLKKLEHEITSRRELLESYDYSDHEYNHQVKMINEQIVEYNRLASLFE